MPPLYKGAISVTHESHRYLPDQGWVERYTEIGKPDFIAGRIDAYRTSGFHVFINREGPYSRLNAERISDITAASFIERWSIGTELVEKDIFAHPTAIAEAKGFANGRAAYRTGIEEAVEEDVASLDQTDYPAATYPFAQKIFFELRRGAEAFERDYLVLSKERSMPITSGFQLQLTSTRTIYTTSQLQSVETIPASILFSLPANPTADDVANEQIKWGWRVRDQEAEIDSDFKVTLRATYAFAQWSTFLYEESGV